MKEKHLKDAGVPHPGFLKWRDLCEKLSRVLPVMPEDPAYVKGRRDERLRIVEDREARRAAYALDNSPMPSDPVGRQKRRRQEFLLSEMVIAEGVAREEGQDAKVYAEDAELAEMIAEMSVQLAKQTPGEIRKEMEGLAALAKQIATKARVKAEEQKKLAGAARAKAEQATAMYRQEIE